MIYVTVCVYYSMVIIALRAFQYRLSEDVVAKLRTQSPWEFLLSASRNTLQSYELSRLAHAANLRKEITALLDQWLEEKTAAEVARWLLEQRDRPDSSPVEDAASEEPRSSSLTASDNFLVDRPVPHNGSRGHS